jgi:hypothetical protein
LNRNKKKKKNKEKLSSCRERKNKNKNKRRASLENHFLLGLKNLKIMKMDLLSKINLL